MPILHTSKVIVGIEKVKVQIPTASSSSVEVKEFTIPEIMIQNTTETYI